MAVQYGYYYVHGTSHVIIRCTDGARWNKLGEVQKEEDAQMIVQALMGTLGLAMPDSLDGLTT